MLFLLRQVNVHSYSQLSSKVDIKLELLLLHFFSGECKDPIHGAVVQRKTLKSAYLLGWSC